MAARAAILVTGTEVLTGRISDRNGPWLAERLGELGVDLAQTTIVGDRPEDMVAALEAMAALGLELIVTSGGLGPTADDLTAEIVGRFQRRPLHLDERLEARIAEIVRPLLRRWANIDPAALRAANRKQAMVPDGATVLEPVGTAPGLVVPPPDGETRPTVLVLPGPPRELQPMWREAVASEPFREAVAGATDYEQRTMRLFGVPESEIAETLRLAADDGIAVGELEVTTCLKRGELEVVTRYEPPARGDYEELERFIAARHGATLFSTDGATVDEQVAALLREGGLTLASAESCTGGLLGGRITELPGSSDYYRGGLVTYANEAKRELAHVDPAVLEEFGAVSEQVAVALAVGAREALHADVGVGITGVAGPGGGTPEKPVGFVCFALADGEGEESRALTLPGSRADVRERATTVALHMLRRRLGARP